MTEQSQREVRNETTAKFDRLRARLEAEGAEFTKEGLIVWDVERVTIVARSWSSNQSVYLSWTLKLPKAGYSTRTSMKFFGMLDEKQVSQQTAWAYYTMFKESEARETARKEAGR